MLLLDNPDLSGNHQRLMRDNRCMRETHW